MEIHRSTHVYKVAGQCEIRADVYRPARCRALLPTIVWIHGGALIGGHRGNTRREQIEAYLGGGLALVSVDYRLAPETKLPSIIRDLEDAFRWIGTEGAGLGLDTSRLAAIGHSAGGYLALVAGYRANPQPKTIISFYGYGDIIGEWYSSPDEFYCKQPTVTEEEAWGTVGEDEISDVSKPNDRGRFYLYLRQHGLWPKVVMGVDPSSDRDAFSAYMPVKNVSKGYPPTLLLHGTDDTDVPYAQSVTMAGELKRNGIVHELYTIQGGGHGFDGAGFTDPQVVTAFSRVMSFLDDHL